MTPSSMTGKGIFGRTGVLSGWFYIRDLASALYFTRTGGPTAPKKLADPFRSWEKDGVAFSWYGSDVILSTKVRFEQATNEDLARASGRWAGRAKSDKKRESSQKNGRLNQKPKL